MESDTRPIPTIDARPRRWPTVLLGLLVVVLAVTTAIGFLRPTGDGSAAAEIARLQSRVAALDGRLDAAQRCIDGYEAQRKEQAGAVKQAQDAIGDVQEALGRLTRFDLGSATDLVARAAGGITDAARRLATADRTTPRACAPFV